MHISDGVAPIPVAVAGALAALPGIAAGLKVLKEERIPAAALVSSVLFLSTLLVRLPLGPSSVHPLLGGLAGLLLGWSAMPAFLVSLFLQALLFQFGGITTLGINTFVMGMPAVGVYLMFNGRIRRERDTRKAFCLGAAAGIAAYLASFVLWAGALLLCGRQLAAIVAIALLPNLVVAVAEGIFTGFIVSFLVRVYPAIFGAPAFEAKGEGL
jgi:cobalt/nickel transport system permease protein